MKNELIKIYSHPRSGTHFLEAFLASNFYKGKDLTSNGDIYYGHWSKKILLPGGEPYHQLFGSHFFPEHAPMQDKMVYIYRDGRAVIASIWNSGFYHELWKGITFSEFLRKDIDWCGGLGQKADPKMNIVQHWYAHLEAWLQIDAPNLVFIRFEDLKNHPEKVYQTICKAYFPLKYSINKYLGLTKVDPIKQKVGLHPNKATINSWKDLFSDDDLRFFNNQIPTQSYLYHE